MALYNIYCDESCHLENDRLSAMSLGAVWCDKRAVIEISDDLRALKSKHGLSRQFEVKWTKVSQAKISFYQELIDYFFSCEALHFRGVVIPDKSQLKHAVFQQDHNLFYYKMFFILLKNIFSPEDQYQIYLDIKDTRSQNMVEGLHQVLRHSEYDFNSEKIQRIQQVRSNESELLQLTDLFIGGLTYLHRGLQTSQAKLSLIQKIKQHSGYSLTRTTLAKEEKLNLLIWQARDAM